MWGAHVAVAATSSVRGHCHSGRSSPHSEEDLVMAVAAADPAVRRDRTVATGVV